MSWKAEVIADRSGKWVSNELRFASKEEAEGYVTDLAMRWTAVRDTRATETPGVEANYRWDVDGLYRLREAE